MSDVLSFTGWIRRPNRRRWERWCRRATEGECLDALIKTAPRGSDKLVRQGSADPNEDKR